MPQVVIEEKGCRGCTLCADICPVDVFEHHADTNRATVERTQDCVGCLACFYICPSQCVTVQDVTIQRPFYRLAGNVALVEKFLQENPVEKALTKEDWQEACDDVGIHIVALCKAITEMLGRGTKALGRQSGVLSAAHLPEMYEQADLAGILTRMQSRFANCFDFKYKLSGEAIDFDFCPCSLAPFVEGSGEKLGESVVCQLFHDFWAGLIGAFNNTRYNFELQSAARSGCKLKLTV